MTRSGILKMSPRNKWRDLMAKWALQQMYASVQRMNQAVIDGNRGAFERELNEQVRLRGERAKREGRHPWE